MVIRFTLRAGRPKEVKNREAKPEMRLASHASGWNRMGPERLSRREVEHREKMLRHLQQLDRRQANEDAARWRS